MPADPVPVSVQTIANAYGSYAAKSLEQTGSFFAQLAGVRSFNKVFELQTEFARQACETFASELQKISELHRELAKQRLRSLGASPPGRRSRPQREHLRLVSGDRFQTETGRNDFNKMVIRRPPRHLSRP